MKIKLLTSRVCGVNGSQNVGDVFECENKEAARMIEAGQAIAIVEEKTERAVKLAAGKETR